MAREHIGEYPADQQAYVKAKGLIRQLGAINQKSPLTYVAAGRLIYESAYIQGHEIEPEALRRARNLFSMTMRLDPRFLDAYIHTSYVCLFENKIAEARIIAQQSANIAQDFAQEAMRYGQIAMRENNLHGGPGGHAEEPRDSGVLSATLSGGEGQEVSVDGLHAQAAHDPQCDAEE